MGTAVLSTRQVSHGSRIPTLVPIISGLWVTLSVPVLPPVQQERFDSQWCGKVMVPPILGGEVV